jgi:hypothetical protein
MTFPGERAMKFSFGTRRFVRFILIAAMLLPLLPRTVEAAVINVVLDWTSPTHGFTISYRRDSFTYDSEVQTASGDRLELKSPAGFLLVESMPYTVSIDDCAIALLTKRANESISYSVIEQVQNGTGTIGTIETNASGQLIDVTYRASCAADDAGTYLVSYAHGALTDQFGRYESAALAVQHSYFPGYPESSNVPPEIRYPDGLIELDVVRVEEQVEPPPDSNLVNHPTRFFTVEIDFTSLYAVDGIVDVNRIFLQGSATALNWFWTYSGQAYDYDWIVVPGGETLTGYFTFALPSGEDDFSLCYQHLTSNDCSVIADHTFDQPVVQQDVGTVTGGGPNSRPRINPGR